MAVHTNPATAKLGSDAFFTEDGFVRATLSPSGELVASLERRESTQVLNVLDIKSKKTYEVLNADSFSEWEAGIDEFIWLDNHHLGVIFLEERVGYENLANSGNIAHFIIAKIDPKFLTPPEYFSVRSRGELVDPLEDEQGVFLYAKNASVSKVYKISAAKLNKHNQKLGKLDRVDGGQFVKSNEVVSLSGYAMRWYANAQNSPSAALTVSSEGWLTLHSIDDQGTATALSSWQGGEAQPFSNGKRFFPLEPGPGPNQFYCLDWSEDQQRSVYLVDFKNKQYDLVYAEDSYDVLDLLVNPETDTLMGVKVLRDGAIAFDYIDQDNQTILDATSHQPELELITTTRENGHAIMYRVAHDEPGHYYLFDNTNNEKYFLGSSQPLVHGKLNSVLIQASVQNDDFSIPYLLSRPTPSSQKPAPLIVLPHGGPFGIYDDVYYSNVVQYLVNQGFAVVRVNFRGSGGYEDEFKNAGKLQWGNKMLEDVNLATLEVTQLDTIDQNSVCVLGFSYGGFAASRLVLDHPDTYRCGITVAGLADVALYAHKVSRTKEGKQWISEFYGDMIEDYELFKEQSPVYMAEKLQRPLLIVHGEQDSVVDIEHAYRLRLALDKFNKRYEWIEYPEEGHSFSSNTLEQLMPEVVTFIKTSLSGNSK